MAKKHHGRKKKSNLRKQLATGLQDQVTRDRKRAAQGKQSSLVRSGIPLWRVDKGDHTIDILPYLAGENHPDISKGKSTYRFEYSLHRDIGPKKQKVLCLESIGAGRCPICEHQAELIEDGADEKKWKPLKAKPWVLFNVICYDKGEEKKGVQVWDSPYFWSLENIMDIAKQRGRGGKPGKTIDFAHPEDGKSISFTVKPPKGPNDYQKYKGFKFEDRDYEIDDELFESCYTLDELIPIPSEEEVEEVLYGSSLRKGGMRKVREQDEDDPMEMLDEAEDNDDLKDIIEKFDLDVKVKKSFKFKKAQRLVKEALEEMLESNDDDDDGDGEIEGLTAEDVEDMSWKELIKLIKLHDLDTDPADFDDEAELAEAIVEEMELI